MHTSKVAIYQTIGIFLRNSTKVKAWLIIEAFNVEENALIIAMLMSPHHKMYAGGRLFGHTGFECMINYSAQGMN